MTEEEARRKVEEERVEAESERVEAEEVRQTQEGAGDTEVSRVDAESERDLAEEERVRVSLSRREAEKERVEAEEGRQDAEKNGREVAESGRVEAESDRVEAEKKRRSMRFFYAKIAGLVAFPLAFVAFIPAVVGIVLMDRAREQNCREIQELKANERAQAIESYGELDRTLRILGLTRTDEIERIARKNRDRALERFAPRKC